MVACAPAQTATPARRETAQSQEWSTYRSRLGYQIDRPNSWAGFPGAPNEEMFATDLSMFLRVNFKALPAGFNLDTHVQQAINFSKSQGRPAEARRVRISNNIDAWRQSYRAPERGFGQEAESLGFIANQEVWSVLFETMSPGIDQKMPTIERVFSSFKLTR